MRSGSRCFPGWRSVVVMLLGMGLVRGVQAQQQVIVDNGVDWKYFKGTVAPAAGWNTLGFVDSGPEWLTGPTGIGYSDNDDATVLADMQNGYMAFFARHAFTTSLAGKASLTLQIDYDDGFVAYLNGAEVARRGLGNPGDPVAFDAGAAAHDAGTDEYIDVPIAELRDGPNVLAIELHNTTIGSTDASFIPRLLVNAVIPPTALVCPVVQGAVNLTWTNNGNYDSIRVERNGTVIENLAGGETTYTDPAPSPLDNRYQVVGVSGGSDLLSNVCTIACTQGTLTCALELVGDPKVTQATISWSGVPDVTSVQINREGGALATLTAGETSYIDPNVEDQQPEDDTDYTVILTNSTGGTCTLACTMSLCPALTGSVVGGQVVLTIGNNVKAWAHFEISREGTVVDAAIPADATTWTDPDVIPEIGNSYLYLLHPVAVPGGEFPTPGTACDQTLYVAYAPEVGRYDPPAGGWDYSIEFNPGQRQYNPVAGETGNLDGRWIRSIDRDLWNGQGPDDPPGAAPDGPAPGGIDIVSRAGLGPCTSNTSVLRVLDPGDTGVGIGTAFPTPFVPAGNSRILLGLDLGVTDSNVLKSGITLSTRLRLSPDSPLYMNAEAASGDGAGIVNGIGQVGVYYKGTGVPGEEVTAAAAFSCNSGAGGGDLEFSSAGQDVDAIGTLSFIAVWMTVVGGAAPDTYDVNIYLNGAFSASGEVGGAGLTLDQGMTDFGPSVVNYVAIGSNDTGGDAMFEIDYVAYKLGVHLPSSTPCPGGEPPNAPTGLRATPGDTRVDLVWSAPTTGPAPGNYAIFRDGARVGAVSASQLTYSDTGRTNGTRYCYTVRSIRGALESSNSNEDCATPAGGGGGTLFHRGDSDGSGSIQLTDAVRILNFLFLGTGAIPCEDAADVDDGGSHALTDAVRILNFLFLGTGVIPSPGPQEPCGPDPTADALDCVTYDRC